MPEAISGEPTEAVAGSVNHFGGIIRCETCGRWEPVGDAGRYMRNGWPKCHVYTMRWWTQRQLDAGEMPVLTESEDAK